MIDQAKIFWILCFKMEEYGWVSQSHVVAAHTSAEAEEIFKKSHSDFLALASATFISTDESQEDHPVFVVTDVSGFTSGRTMSTEDLEQWIKVMTKPSREAGEAIRPQFRSIMR